MGDDKPAMPYLTKASSEADAKDVPILLWKPHQYNDLGNGHSEFIIGSVTIWVMTLSKTSPTYFLTTSSAMLYGNMALLSVLLIHMNVLFCPPFRGKFLQVQICHVCAPMQHFPSDFNGKLSRFGTLYIAAPTQSTRVMDPMFHGNNVLMPTVGGHLL